ncbi:M14 family zinc carboxypeptidase [Francisella philomiragia]|uniref:Succinylglutamate desuccinylase/aspartoacylase family protein n=1 Tax=Francisella philomiragia TaxID=28110 RepID=A0ABS1GCS5_9GAMM|nr:succinylglutamate desuccinylase/aspartoacylase family protein [Francisella philomiragia]MBK2258792.1 succinylglutamate desuccinylase/aspartoacylase family protein [Francisella philomiragia]MBK2302483.1 succinylglutamate desuccinylase/aspartoacylase family protein [Francisella philomiragia]
MSNYISKQKIKVSQSSTGEDIHVEKITIKGSNSSAPSVYMQASMHASELQGNAVMVELLEYFKKHQPKGDVYLIPQCNPIGKDVFIGAGHQGRFDSATGDNFNRYYFYPSIDYSGFVKEHINSTTAEYKQAFENLLQQELDKELSNEWELSRAKRLNLLVQREAQKADYVLDLHTDTDATTYLYTADFAKEIAESFGYKDMLIINNDKAGGSLDEAIFCPWWHLSQEFRKQGRDEKVLKEGYTLELGSEEYINFINAKMQTQGILNYLKYKDIIDSPFDTDLLNTDIRHHIYGPNYKHLKAIEGGLYEWFIKPGDIFKAGDVIGQYIQTSTMQKKDLILPYGGVVISIHNTGAVCQGSQLINLAII